MVSRSRKILIIQTILLYFLILPGLTLLIIIRFNEIPTEVLIGFLIASIVCSLLTLPLSIVSFIFSLIQKNENQKLLKTSMIVKLVLIPYYVINFIYCFVLIAVAGNPWMMIGIPFIIFISFFNTYCSVLSTSLHSFVFVLKYLIKNKIKPNPATIVGLVFHFFFCIDVIGGILLCLGFKDLKKVELPS